MKTSRSEAEGESYKSKIVQIQKEWDNNNSKLVSEVGDMKRTECDPRRRDGVACDMSWRDMDRPIVIVWYTGYIG